MADCSSFGPVAGGRFRDFAGFHTGTVGGADAVNEAVGDGCTLDVIVPVAVGELEGSWLETLSEPQPATSDAAKNKTAVLQIFEIIVVSSQSSR